MEVRRDGEQGVRGVMTMRWGVCGAYLGVYNQGVLARSCRFLTVWADA